ncbi:hypothetical protein QFZ51_004685 [Chitinophaga sp. W3I9]
MQIYSLLSPKNPYKIPEKSKIKISKISVISASDKIRASVNFLSLYP